MITAIVLSGDGIDRFSGRKLNELFLETAVNGDDSEYEDRVCLCLVDWTIGDRGEEALCSAWAGLRTKSVRIGIGSEVIMRLPS